MRLRTVGGAEAGTGVGDIAELSSSDLGCVLVALLEIQHRPSTGRDLLTRDLSDAWIVPTRFF